MPGNSRTELSLGSKVIGWCALTLLSAGLPNSPLVPAASILTLALSLAFSLVHGAQRYGCSGSLAFFGIAILVANVYETASITTGFPFGYYVHNAGMGPKINVVPIIVGVGFYTTTYLSWTMANTLIGEPRRAGEAPWGAACAIVATFIAVSFDVFCDPTGALVNGLWTYRQGGAFFGVLHSSDSSYVRFNHHNETSAIGK